MAVDWRRNALPLSLPLPHPSDAASITALQDKTRLLTGLLPTSVHVRAQTLTFKLLLKWAQRRFGLKRRNGNKRDVAPGKESPPDRNAPSLWF